MDLGLQGKKALVLSAGGGLGRAIAHSLASEGALLAITDRNEASLAETAREIASMGGDVCSTRIDLGDIASIDGGIAEMLARRGGIDILINLSGGPPPTPATGVSPDQWNTYFQAMVLSMIRITDLVLPGMRERRWGRILTSTSSGILAPIPNLGISNTLRSSLVGWSKTLAREVAAEGITANIVVPGRIATRRVRQLDEARAVREGKSVQEIEQASTATIPMGRYGDPSEYADAITFLASTRASYITGSVFRIDGGMNPGI